MTGIESLEQSPASVIERAIRERDTARAEAEHYRMALLTIQVSTDPNKIISSRARIALLLELVHNCAGRALNYVRPERQTWRDRWAARWQTFRAR